jgi:glucose-6-phosphate isomerase
VIYAGNSLSPSAFTSLIARIEGRLVYVNVIAKNFATLEPGVTFRVLRHWLEDRYGKAGAARRIIATGTPGASLEALSRKNGYRTLPFPQEIGGRFSVLSAVGLLPIAVAGVDVTAMLAGARSVQRAWESDLSLDNPLIRYALTRHLLYGKGFRTEILAHFEPCLAWFAKWWIQLFGESEGKQGSGIYPSSCSFSEDLHALGQYIQDGPRTHSETFIDVLDAGSFLVPPEAGDDDGFGYVDGKDFALLNRVAFQSTLQAHSSGGVPCTVIQVPSLDASVFGQLFIAFELACYLSASLFGVNPFDQPGVEAYKNAMFAGLGKRPPQTAGL